MLVFLTLSSWSAERFAKTSNDPAKDFRATCESKVEIVSTKLRDTTADLLGVAESQIYEMRAVHEDSNVP